MRTKILILLITALVLAFGVTLTGCEVERAPAYDAGQYVLAGAELDGETISVSSLFPEGGYLLLSADGTGRLILGADSCEISWQQGQGDYSVRINELAAAGKREDGFLRLTLENLGLVLLFSEGDASAAIRQAESASVLAETEETKEQLLWNGDWSGRLWFEDPKGEWEEYTDQTLSVSATVTLDADGAGLLRLHSKYYSDLLPMASVSFVIEEYKVHCLSGYMTSYPVPEWGMEIALSTERAADVEDTVIMHPDIYEYGHFYNADPPVDRNAKTDVLRLSGSCHDLNGGFDYKIVLTRAEAS